MCVRSGLAGNALMPFNMDTVIISEIMRKLRSKERLNNLPRSQRQMPCSYPVHRSSERFGISKAKLSKDGIEAAQPPSPSHSALPLPLLPCRGMVHLQASAPGSSHGVSLRILHGILHEGKIHLASPTSTPPPPSCCSAGETGRRGGLLSSQAPCMDPCHGWQT